MKDVYFVVCDGRRVACRWTYEDACDWMAQIRSLDCYSGKELYVRRGALE